MAADEYEITIVRHGTMPTTRSEVFLNHRHYGEADGPAPTDYYLWIVRNEERTILVDTGFSAQAAARRGRQVLLPPSEAYRELGVDTTAEHTVVVSHAHYDHIGNLDLFPSASVVVSATELAFWDTDISGRFLISFHVEAEDLEALRRARAEGRVRTFTGTEELAPGVELIEVGGHTPGQSMVRVATSEGPVLLASDAVHFRRELDEDMPFASVTDLPGLYRGLDLVRQMRDEGVRVVTGHDPQELDGCRRPQGPLAEHAGIIGRPAGGG